MTEAGICESCGLIKANIATPRGVRVYRVLDHLDGAIRIVAVRRHGEGRYAKGLSLSYEWLEDAAGSVLLAEQLKDPIVRDEIDRLTILAIDSVMAGEKWSPVGDAVEMDTSPRPE